MSWNIGTIPILGDRVHILSNGIEVSVLMSWKRVKATLPHSHHFFPLGLQPNLQFDFQMGAALLQLWDILPENSRGNRHPIPWGLWSLVWPPRHPTVLEVYQEIVPMWLSVQAVSRGLMGDCDDGWLSWLWLHLLTRYHLPVYKTIVIYKNVPLE